MSARSLLVGGLGWPHDELAAAAFRASGIEANALGALDQEALERGRSLLPRGQCAPMLYLTGALVRAVDARPTEPQAVLAVQSCGPCRFALFAPEWRRQLDRMGCADVWISRVAQTAGGLARALGGSPRGLLEAIAVADALRETARRVAPHAVDPDDVDRAARAAGSRIAARVAAGASPVGALREERGWHFEPRRAPPRPLARAVVVGEPWSLHVDGDGQLHLPQALARAGVEVELPPASLWLEYVLWQTLGPAFGRELADAAARASARELSARLREAFDAAADAAGLAGFAIDDVAELAELAAPYLPPTLRGGYGHVEVGLAVRARLERRAHVVLSVRSFGCVPSAGITDGILPAALGAELPFLALEVCGDGEAARESRLSLRVAAALDAAEEELRAACRAHGVDEARARSLALDPLRGWPGPRAYACTLACAALGPPC